MAAGAVRVDQLDPARAVDRERVRDPVAVGRPAWIVHDAGDEPPQSAPVEPCRPQAAANARENDACGAGREVSLAAVADAVLLGAIGPHRVDGALAAIGAKEEVAAATRPGERVVRAALIRQPAASR